MFHNRFNRFLYNVATDASDANAGAGSDHAAGTDADTRPAGAGVDAAAPPARPEWFPEKYYKDGGPEDVEKLGRSYTELQGAFSKKYPHYEDVPADSAGYKLQPESLPEGVVWTPEVGAKFAEVFHKNGVGQSQAKAITDTFIALEAESIKAAGDAYETQKKADVEKLTEKWGGPEKYEAKRAEIAALVTENLGADPEDAALFSHPRVVEFLGKTNDYVKALESKLGEDAKAAAKGAVAAGNTFTSQAAEASRIMSDPTHPDNKAYLSGDTNIQKKVLRMLGAESE